MSNVLFKRLEDSSELDNMPVIDGSLYITKDGKTFIDYDEDRIPVGGTPDTEMSDRSTNTVENKVIKEYVDTNFIQKGKILWTNANPESNFNPQTITLNSSDYDILEFVFRYSAGNDAKMFFMKTFKGHGVEVSCIINYNVGVNQATSIPWRQATYIDDTHYNISDCYERNTNETTTPSISNNRLIPLYVIGYKTGLFD